MLREDALRSIYSELEERIVVTNMGAAAAELFALGHRPNFFYLEHAMGLASSIGLGLALCATDQKIVVLDGDGSVLMNLGTLSTMARYHPPNLVHLIFDNESHLSVGGFPTATSTGTDLAGVASAAGIERVTFVTALGELQEAFSQALEAEATSVIVAKVEPVGPPSFHLGIGLLENRFQFQRHVTGLRSGQNSG